MAKCSSSSSKISSQSKMSNYNTNYSEPIDKYRAELHRTNNILNLTPTESLQMFLAIQNRLDHVDNCGIFDGLKSVETELQIIQANRYDAENIYKTLYEQNERERVNDFFAPTVQSFYVNKRNDDPPMSLEQVNS